AGVDEVGEGEHDDRAPDEELRVLVRGHRTAFIGGWPCLAWPGGGRAWRWPRARAERGAASSHPGRSRPARRPRPRTPSVLASRGGPASRQALLGEPTHSNALGQEVGEQERERHPVHSEREPEDSGKGGGNRSEERGRLVERPPPEDREVH